MVIRTAETEFRPVKRWAEVVHKPPTRHVVDQYRMKEWKAQPELTSMGNPFWYPEQRIEQSPNLASTSQPKEDQRKRHTPLHVSQPPERVSWGLWIGCICRGISPSVLQYSGNNLHVYGVLRGLVRIGWRHCKKSSHNPSPKTPLHQEGPSQLVELRNSTFLQPMKYIYCKRPPC